MIKKLFKNECFYLLLVTALSCIPLFWPALFQANPGHDLQFHMQRIAAISKNLEAGLPMQLQLFWAHNQGYAVGAFYPSLFLIPFAWLFKMGMNMDVVWKLLCVSINFATVFISYYSFERLFKKKSYAFLAMLLYVFAPYRLTDVYLRSALGESLAMIFLPLAAESLHNIYEKDSKAWIRMGIAYAGICASHELSLFLVVLFTAFYCLFRFKKTFEKQTFLNLCKATGLAVVLSLYFLVPMQNFSKYNELKMNHEIRNVYAESAYEWQLFSFFEPVFGGSGHLGYYGHEMPFYLGWPLLFGLVLFPWVTNKEETKEEWILYILSWIAVWMCSRFFPYDKLSEIGFFNYFIVKIQFPWRFELITSILLSILTVVTLTKLGNLQGKKVLKFLCCFAVVLGVCHQVSFKRHANYGAIQTLRDLDSNNYMGGEFLPDPHVDKYLKRTPAVITRGKCDIKNVKRDGFTYEFEVSNQTNQFQKVTLPLIYYKQYKGYQKDNGRKLVTMNNQKGRLCVVVPDHYKETIVVTYKEPISFKVARWISLATLIVLCGYGLSHLKLRKH